MKKRKINLPGTTWFILMVLAIIFFVIAINFIVFPDKYKLPLAIVLLVIVVLMGFLSLKKRKKRLHGKKDIKRIIVTVINCILCVALAAGSIYLPILQSQMKGMFVEPSDTQEIRISAYVMTSDYKSAHTDVFKNTTSSDDLADYKDAKFLTQTKMDQDNQTYALSEIQKQLNVNSLNLVTKDDIWKDLAALYDGTGDVLVMNESYASTVSEVQGYENFSKDTKIIYTVVKEVEVQKVEKTETNYTNTPFMVFFAGSDSRTSDLSLYTRTDVDMLLTVDPVNKQILIVTMPRDWYVKNPALGNGYDKLTHLGNNGLQNTMDGLNSEFGFSYIKDYFELNFVTFYNIVEGLGGIDINNPTVFSAASGDEVGGKIYGGEYYFDAGPLHLDGNEALSYVRERYNLPDGDYGRNQHQTIVIQAIINKLTSKELISHYSSVLQNLQGNFLSSISSEDIYSLAEMQLNDGGSWNFVSYHLDGIGDSNVTASMGDQLLYVAYPLAQQVTFAKQQMEKVMNGEVITQETLPTDDQTTYLPN
jgi:LCP family protein required for cell wall assembly